MQPAILDKLRGLVGPPHVLTGIELSSYVIEGRTPDAAVFPGSVDEVQAVVRLAAEAGIPLSSPIASSSSNVWMVAVIMGR